MAQPVAQADITAAKYSVYLLDDQDADSRTVVSGHDDPQIAVDAVKAGAQEFMLKWPADAAAFASLVSMALARGVVAESVEEARPAAG